MMHCAIHRWIVIFCIVALVVATALLPGQVVAATTISASTHAQIISQSPAPWASSADGKQTPLLAQRAATLNGLVDQADLIVRGRVTEVQSAWRADHRLIESSVTVAIAYTLLGHGGQTMTIHTPGGYLAAEGIGMVSMHAADFGMDEEVLLFLQRVGQRWQMVDGATGKFLIQGEQVVNRDRVLVESIDGLLATVATLCENRGATRTVPLLWRHTTSTIQPTPLYTTQQPVDARRWPTPHATAAYYVNLNTTQTAGGSTGNRTSDFRNAIIAAANRWSALASADFALRYGGPTTATTTGYNGVNEILFMHKGAKERAAAAEVWYTRDLTIVEADIWINDDYQWSTTGMPAANEVDLQSALVHEFGHWLILAHMAQAESVMFPRLTAGTVKRELQAEDIAGISAIYPR